MARSLHRRVAVSLVAVSLVFTLGANVATWLVARQAVQGSVERRLDRDAALLTARVADLLRGVGAGVATLASNPLLSSALVDSAGREQYLVPFLRDFQPNAALPVDLTLCDFRGQPIASGRGGKRARGDDAWLRQVVELDQPRARLGAGREHATLVLAAPVHYPETNTAEGVLVAEFELAALLEASRRGVFDAEEDATLVRLLGPGGAPVYQDPGGGGDHTARLHPLAAGTALAELGLTLEVGSPRQAVVLALRPLAWSALLGTVLAVVAGLWLARRQANLLTRPLVRLSAAAARVAESGRMDAVIPEEGMDEVGHLAGAFNNVLRRLRRATEDRLAELEARNAELVRAHEEARRLEVELRGAQKLEAVGRLASGIGHEINTPIQFIGDNTTFLREALQACFDVLDAQREALAGHAPPAVVAAVEAKAEEVDLPYVREQAPRAIDRTLAGAQRVATIVRAMKEFAHPDQKALEATDLNRAIQSTLEIARNEYKYVARVEASYGDLPAVTCHGGDVNQVFLNVLVNAAHAVGDAVKGTGQLGTIRIATARQDDQAVITFTDDGPGIPAAARDHIFEPFFTTKEIGRGTGQGLAIARSVVERHQGSIDFTTEEGKGTTFTIRLPIAGPQQAPPRADPGQPRAAPAPGATP
jgi:signal transduction histidine kinase